MNAQTRKEIRTILPFFAVAVLAPLLTVPLTGFWPGETIIGLTMVICGIAGVAMSVMTFGDEFSNRTMGLLLTQPLSRSEIWRRKMLVLCAALTVYFLAVGIRVFIHLGCCLQGPTFLALGLVLFLTIGIYCTAPFWTMGFKNALGAIAATFAAPIGLMFWTDMLMERFFPRWSWGASSHTALVLQPESLLIACILALYFALWYWLGRITFLHLEVTDSPGREIALPERLQPLFAPLWRALMPGHGGPIRSLITKKLYLQRVSFGMAIVFGVVFFFGAASWRLSKSEWATVTMATFFALNFLLNSVITGGVCVAEERNWGMLGWQLSLPASKRSQWFVKVSVALGTSLVLGVILPITVFELCKWLFNFPINPFTNPDSPLGNGSDKPGILLCFLVYLILPCMAILASSLSTNTMKAVVMALVMTILAFSCIQPAVMAGERVIPYFEIRSSWLRIHADWRMDRPIISITIVLILGLILFFSFRNYATGEISSRRRWLQPMILLLSISGCLFALNLMMRSWNY